MNTKCIIRNLNSNVYVFFSLNCKFNADISFDTCYSRNSSNQSRIESNFEISLTERDLFLVLP